MKISKFFFQADLVCKQMGFSSAIDFKTKSFFGPVNQPFTSAVWPCDGSEKYIQACLFPLAEDFPEEGVCHGAGVVCAP